VCGRFTQHWTWRQLRDASEPFWEVPDFADDPKPRYNLAPTQDALVIRRSGNAIDISPVRWGFPKPGGHPGEVINARAETADTLAMFKDSMARHRCLIPASGFYEWDRCPDGSKQPWHLAADGPLFFLAGLWREEQGRPRFVTLTFETPEAFEPAIHHRMPGVVRPEDAAAWLSPDLTDPARARDLARPFGDPAAFPIRAWPISTRVNTPRSDDPTLLDRAEPEVGLFG
jgi:putative SOS response-associated peptidase YedK